MSRSPSQYYPRENEAPSVWTPESDSAGERDFGPELFGIGGGSERGRHARSQAQDEAFYDQSDALRRGFGHRGEMPAGHWQSEHAELGLAQPPQGWTSHMSSGTWETWRGDVARDRRGPRGYVRTDERIREFICERLAQLHQLDVSDVSVDVSAGRVTLEGTVPDRSMKHRIEDTADSCWGVQEVENRIRVRSTEGEQGAYGVLGPLHESGSVPGWSSEADPGATGGRSGGGRRE